MFLSEARDLRFPNKLVPPIGSSYTGYSKLVKELQIEKRPENHISASAPLLPKFVPRELLRGITNFGNGALTQGNTVARGISRAT